MTETTSMASLSSNCYKTLRDLTTSIVTEIQLAYSYIRIQWAQAIILQTRKGRQEDGTGGYHDKKNDNDAKSAGTSSAQKEKTLKKKNKEGSQGGCKTSDEIGQAGKYQRRHKLGCLRYFDIARSLYEQMIFDAKCLCVAIKNLDAFPIRRFGIKVELAGVPLEKF